MSGAKRGISKQGAFLKAFAATASVTKAAEAAKIDRALPYRWLRHDPAYALRFAEARENAAQVLEDEAVKRAHEGVLEPVWYKGKACGVTRVFSDTLLMFVLKGLKPETYRDRAAVEVTGPAGGPIQLADKRFEELSDAELESLVEIARKLTPAE